MADDDAPFLSRWARRKSAAREGIALVEPVPPPTVAIPPRTAAEALPARSTEVATPPAAEDPKPTLDDVTRLTRESDFTRFVGRDVEPEVKNAALKKLFADPHFNVMDGLDTYIDDYGKPDPLPAHWLRQMVQSKVLGLFDDESDRPETDTAAQPTASSPHSDPERHAHPDLQLQPNDDAGRVGAAPGVGQDTGRPD